MSSSARTLRPLATSCAACARSHFGERIATFCRRAAAAATTAAAADPLAGAGAPDAILLSR
jgi:hypothetical protein